MAALEDIVAKLNGSKKTNAVEAIMKWTKETDGGGPGYVNKRFINLDYSTEINLNGTTVSMLDLLDLAPTDMAELFEQAGLRVTRKWKDLHVLSWSWITMNGWLPAPFRALQALALAVWPLRWQYQVYHLCVKS